MSDNRILSNIRNNITECRKNLGWSQAKLARDSGLTSACVSLLEKGGRAPSLITLSKISFAFGCEISELTQDRFLTDEKSVLYAKLSWFNYCTEEDQDIIVKLIKRLSRQA